MATRRGTRAPPLQGGLVPLALAGGARARGGVDVADSGGKLASVAVLVGILDGVGEEAHIFFRRGRR